MSDVGLQQKPFFIKKYIDTFKENWYNVFVSVRNLQNKQTQLIDDFSNKVLSDKGVNTSLVFTLGLSIHFVA